MFSRTYSAALKVKNVQHAKLNNCIDMNREIYTQFSYASGQVAKLYAPPRRTKINQIWHFVYFPSPCLYSFGVLFCRPQNILQNFWYFLGKEIFTVGWALKKVTFLSPPFTSMIPLMPGIFSFFCAPSEHFSLLVPLFYLANFKITDSKLLLKVQRKVLDFRITNVLKFNGHSFIV